MKRLHGSLFPLLTWSHMSWSHHCKVFRTKTWMWPALANWGQSWAGNCETTVQWKRSPVEWIVPIFSLWSIIYPSTVLPPRPLGPQLQWKQHVIKACFDFGNTYLFSCIFHDGFTASATALHYLRGHNFTLPLCPDRPITPGWPDPASRTLKTKSRHTNCTVVIQIHKWLNTSFRSETAYIIIYIIHTLCVCDNTVCVITFLIPWHFAPPSVRAGNTVEYV